MKTKLTKTLILLATLGMLTGCNFGKSSSQSSIQSSSESSISSSELSSSESSKESSGSSSSSKASSSGDSSGKQSTYKISLDKKTLEIMMDQSDKLNATLDPTPTSEFYTYSISYSSSNLDVVSVDSNGNLKAVGLGTATVTVKYKDDSCTDTCEVTVVPFHDQAGNHAASVSFSKKSLIMANLDATTKLAYTILPEDSVDKSVTFSSSNPSIASVDNDGNITSHAAGSTVITIKTNDRNKKDLITVTVIDPSASYGTGYYDDYYGNLTWTDGEDLKTKLYNIISKDKNTLKYNAVWNINQEADKAMDDYSKVDPVYTSVDEVRERGTAKWSREHAFCASLMCGFTTGEATTSPGRSSDWHNLFAANDSGNSSRSNKNLGYAHENDAIYRKGSDTASYLDYSYDRYNFEPSDVDKGMLARAIFYMGVMYSKPEEASIKVTLTYSDDDPNKGTSKSSTVTIPTTLKPLEIVEEYVDYSKVNYTSYYYGKTDEALAAQQRYGKSPEGYARYSEDNCQFAIGNLSDLLAWNSFPVLLKEVQHNEAVFTTKVGTESQNNRNPFIDYPGLVEYIYGPLKDTAGSLDQLKPTFLALNMNEDAIDHYALVSTPESYAVGDTFTPADCEILAVKNDLSTTTATISGNEYTFTAADAEAGTKTISIDTGKNTLKFDVKVTTKAVEEAYKHTFVKDDVYGVKSSNTLTKTLDGVEWKISNSLDSCTVTNSSAYGVKLGKNDGGIGTLTFETSSAFAVGNKKLVDAIRFRCICNKNATVNYKFYVADTLVAQGDITAEIADAPLIDVGGSFTPCEGKVKLVFESTTTAFYINSMGISAK